MTKYSRENSYYLNNYRNILLSILFCFEKKIYDKKFILTTSIFKDFNLLLFSIINLKTPFPAYITCLIFNIVSLDVRWKKYFNA